jgi:cell division protein FtsQ
MGLYYLSPFGRINSIDVSSDEVDRSEVLSVTGLKVGDQLWKLLGQKQSLAAKAVKADPRITNLTISNNSGQVFIKVEEKQKYGYSYQDSSLFVLKKDGSIGEKIDKPEPGTPIFVNFKKDDLKTAVKSFAKLDFPIRRDVSQIQYTPTLDNTNRIVLYMNDQNIVYANLDDFQKKMKYYSAMANTVKQPSVIDLQFSAFARPQTDDDKNIVANLK